MMSMVKAIVHYGDWKKIIRCQRPYKGEQICIDGFDFTVNHIICMENSPDLIIYFNRDDHIPKEPAGETFEDYELKDLGWEKKL